MRVGVEVQMVVEVGTEAGEDAGTGLDSEMVVRALYSPTLLEFKNRLELKSPTLHHIISSKDIEL